MRVAVGSVALTGLLVACTTPSGNFQNQTEDYLNDDGLIENQFGDVSGAACERPDGTAIGTTYRCTASGPDGALISFTIQIIAENEFSVVGFSGG